jgi:polyhydroxybutyrate depolymerase
MKRIFGFVLTFIFSISLFSCSKTTDETLAPLTPSSVKGKNRFTTNIDGDVREYYVHIPSGYTGTTPVPVVFMLHGTSGDGEKFYNNSGWKEVGEDENIITVYPSSWRYCIIDEGVQKNTTKWNTPPDADWYFCAGQTPRNDIKFLNTVISELNAKYKIDNKRIYLVGFSNGGQMAAKCSVELSDKLAAVAESAGSFYVDTTYIPKRKLPILFQVGNEDYGPGNTGPAIPMDKLAYLISTPGLAFKNGSFYRKASTHIKSFGINPAFTISGDTNSISYATYNSLIPGSVNEFKYLLIKGLGHAYPNGENHWMEGARVHWAWFKQYSMP